MPISRICGRSSLPVFGLPDLSLSQSLPHLQCLASVSAPDLSAHLHASPHLQFSALSLLQALPSLSHLPALPSHLSALSSSSSLVRAKKSNFSGGSPSDTAQMRYTVPMYPSFSARSSSSGVPAAWRRRSSAANSRSLELRYCLKSSELREFSDSG